MWLRLVIKSDVIGSVLMESLMLICDGNVTWEVFVAIFCIKSLSIYAIMFDVAIWSITNSNYMIDIDVNLLYI